MNESLTTTAFEIHEAQIVREHGVVRGITVRSRSVSVVGFEQSWNLEYALEGLGSGRPNCPSSSGLRG